MAGSPINKDPFNCRGADPLSPQEAELLTKELRQAYLAELFNLKDDLLNVILMKIFEHPYKAIARALEISEEVARTRYHRGRAKVEKELEKKGIIPKQRRRRRGR